MANNLHERFKINHTCHATYHSLTSSFPNIVANNKLLIMIAAQKKNHFHSTIHVDLPCTTLSECAPSPDTLFFIALISMTNSINIFTIKIQLYFKILQNKRK